MKSHRKINCVFVLTWDTTVLESKGNIVLPIVPATEYIFLLEMKQGLVCLPTQLEHTLQLYW